MQMGGPLVNCVLNEYSNRNLLVLHLSHQIVKLLVKNIIAISLVIPRKKEERTVKLKK